MKRVLFLDDSADRHRLTVFPGCDVVRAYDYEQAVRALDALPPFDVAYLDHDLFYGSTPHNGYHVATFITCMPAHRRPRRVIIHSHNEIEREKMHRLLVQHGIESTIEPFGTPPQPLEPL